MPKIDVDFSDLSNKITKRAYKLEDVRDKLERVAFDIVRFKEDDNDANLWQVQSADDGDYIVALYNDEEDIEKKASHNPWSVSLYMSDSIQVSYKGDPLVKMASSKLGIPASELKEVSKYLPAKLASNPKLVKALLKELGPTALQEVSKRYPELTSKVS